MNAGPAGLQACRRCVGMACGQQGANSAPSLRRNSHSSPQRDGWYQLACLQMGQTEGYLLLCRRRRRRLRRATWHRIAIHASCIHPLGQITNLHLPLPGSNHNPAPRAAPPLSGQRSGAMAQPSPTLASPAQLLAMLQQSGSGRGEPPLEVSWTVLSFFPLGLWHSALVLTGSWPDVESAAPPCAALQELMESVQRKQAGAAPAAVGQLEVFPEPG